MSRLLRAFGDVRPGECGTTVLLLLNLMLVLAGYYVCKTAREPLILATGGAELKSYASAGQALALMVFVPAYGWFASRVGRARLLLGVNLFFAANLELFWIGAQLGVPYLGVLFYVWVGIFNNAVVAQFWSYGNDLFDQPTGARLFPVIAIGATLGSPLGADLAARLFSAGVRAYDMLHVTAAVLLVSIALYRAVERRQGGHHATAAARIDGGAGGFELLLASPYLRLVALLLLLLNLVNTTGEYILGRAVVEEAAARALADPGFGREAFIGNFYGRYFFWVNVVTVLLQAFVASRLVAWLGLRGALLALPVVALGAYGAVVMGAGFALIRWAKTAENGTDYSIMNTARQLMWLPTTRAEKYKAKQAADTFVVRAGDVASAGLVWLGTEVVGLGARGFALANLALIGAWLLIAHLLLREYARLCARGERLAADQATAPASA